VSNLVPVIAILAIFGLPYVVIYIQGRRLAAIEKQLTELTLALRDAKEAAK
jgi:hypothetical protein